jgi:hypothetical protein
MNNSDGRKYRRSGMSALVVLVVAGPPLMVLGSLAGRDIPGWWEWASLASLLYWGTLFAVYRVTGNRAE